MTPGLDGKAEAPAQQDVKRQYAPGEKYYAHSTLSITSILRYPAGTMVTVIKGPSQKELPTAHVKCRLEAPTGERTEYHISVGTLNEHCLPDLREGRVLDPKSPRAEEIRTGTGVRCRITDVLKPETAPTIDGVRALINRANGIE